MAIVKQIAYGLLWHAQPIENLGAGVPSIDPKIVIDRLRGLDDLLQEVKLREHTPHTKEQHYEVAADLLTHFEAQIPRDERPAAIARVRNSVFMQQHARTIL